MSDWIEIPLTLFEKYETTEESDGVEIVIGLSPFDIPEKVRGHFDKEDNKFIIEFQYLDTSERRIPRHIDHIVSVQIGENSKRLYAIEVDVKNEKIGRVDLSLVERAIDSVAEQVQPQKKQLFDMAKRVIESKENELLVSCG